MALKNNQIFKGLVIPDCVITVAIAGVTSQEIIYLLERRVTIEGAALFATSHVVIHDLNGGNAIKQAYVHAKTLPEMVDAVDYFIS